MTQYLLGWEYVNKHFEETLKRIEIATGIKTMTELARIVGSTQQYVSKKSREGEFPVTWAYEVAKKYDLSTDWIMLGEYKKKNSEIKILNELEEWVAEEIKGQPKKEDWLEIQLQESFPSFKKWKEGKEKSENHLSDFPSSKVA
jgi:hypothetical protein